MRKRLDKISIILVNIGNIAVLANWSLILVNFTDVFMYVLLNILLHI